MPNEMGNRSTYEVLKEAEVRELVMEEIDAMVEKGLLKGL
jgi:hypothetical protein